ncbi:MAG: efflux RND transporter permease subunit [Candidatus Woesearchaeota archaeon]
MSKVRQILTNWKVLLVITSIIIGLIIIQPNPFRSGAAIRSIVENSPAYNAGMRSPEANSMPMSREVIFQFNNQKIRNAQDYYEAQKLVLPGTSVRIITNKRAYLIYVPENNESLAAPDLGIRVYDAPTSNIRKGLDLQGGTRVILKPEENATQDQIDMTIDSMNERLNVYGLSDVTISKVSDLQGKQYIVVEIAGAYEDEIRELIAKQGKFEAKIGNETIFSGGNDIVRVCRTAECSGLDTSKGCSQDSKGVWYCRFRFAVTLSQAAAKRQAEATSKLSVAYEPGSQEQYLNESLDLYLDGQNVDTLRIGAELKGQPFTDIAISGSGSGRTMQEAKDNALANMKRLQTILVTGSLPVKLEVQETSSISPTLGEQFLKNTALTFFVAIVGVAGVLFLFYRRIKISALIMITGLIEIFLTIAFLTLLGWNIDLSAIAGLLAAVGSNVDDQIVMADEELYEAKEEKKKLSWKEKIKNAFYIITGNYLTSVASVFPMLFAGAGILKGFAITTIVGLTIGILITRPAFAEVIEIIMRKD